MASRYRKNPEENHWTTVKNILKYLRRTKDLILVYGGEEYLVIMGYCDASFQIDHDNSKSQAEYIYICSMMELFIERVSNKTVRLTLP
jgi:GGDEF domain-containing protein